MFELQRAVACLPFTPEEVLELHVSVNQPQVSAEGLSEEARAYYCSGKGPHGLEAYIYLHMLASNRAVIYQWNAAIDKTEYMHVKGAAIEFTESMGFMMEDVQIRRMQPEQRFAALAATPLLAPLGGSGLSPSTLVVEPETEVPLELMPTAATDESIVVLTPASSEPTVAGYASTTPQDDPLQDKNLKVFFRLLTSV